MIVRTQDEVFRPQIVVVATLQIILEDMTHDLSKNVERERERIHKGDVMGVFRTGPFATRNPDTGDWHMDEPITGLRMGFVHMTDVPNERWDNMRIQFKSRLPVDENDDAKGHARLRKWRFRFGDLIPARRNELLTNRELTLAWGAARQHIRRKQYTVLDDPTLDDDSAAVHDDDLPAGAVAPSTRERALAEKLING